MTAAAQTQAGELALDADLLLLQHRASATSRVTPLESRLLQLLLANAGQVVHTDRLLVHVWGHRGGGDRQLLKQLVHRLRQKIGDDPEAAALAQYHPQRRLHAAHELGRLLQHLSQRRAPPRSLAVGRAASSLSVPCHSLIC